MSFNQILTPGDIENGIVNVVVEIPAGSVNKIEWNRDEDAMQLDRVEASSEPFNYGFIPQTLNEDGDALDVIIIDKPLATETYKKSRIIGVIKFDDEGVSDDKIIAVPDDAIGAYSKIFTIDDMSKDATDKITYHLKHSKDFKGQDLALVKGWGDKEEAKKIINSAINRWDKSKEK